MCIIIGKSIRTTVKNEDSQHPFDERIIWKYFDGTATSEEEQELSQWLATSEKHRREVAELRAVRSTDSTVGSMRSKTLPARRSGPIVSRTFSDTFVYTPCSERLRSSQSWP